MGGLVDFKLDDVGSLFTSLREAITGKKIEDPVELAKVQLQLDQMQNALTQGQLEINKVEAASTNWFVAGWRPYVGWICGTGLAYQFLFMPIANGLSIAFIHSQVFPAIDMSSLITCLGGLLGLGSLRTFEKYTGVNRDH